MTVGWASARNPPMITSPQILSTMIFVPWKLEQLLFLNNQFKHYLKVDWEGAAENKWITYPTNLQLILFWLSWCRERVSSCYSTTMRSVNIVPPEVLNESKAPNAASINTLLTRMGSSLGVHGNEEPSWCSAVG